jgi:1-acyl-sn-glycerol-3-phosphate acyltransferase
MNNEETRAHCAALTRSGQPCKNLALPGSRFCHLHRETAAVPPEALQPAPPQQAVAATARPSAAASNGKQATAAGPAVAPDAPATSAPAPSEAVDPLDPAAQQQLLVALEDLIRRVRSAAGGYIAPAFSVNGLVQLIKENVERFSPGAGWGFADRLRKTITEDLLNIDTWKGIWFVINYSIDMQAGWLKRRLTGEYQTDDWGLDWEFLQAVMPFFQFMYKTYWRTETTGLEYVPSSGRALLVANHSGQLPWDGIMIATAIMTEHPSGRLLRNLFATWFPTLPVLSAMSIKCGQVLATVENGSRLLDNDELVGVYPEGYKGVGKLYKERYRLARFGRGGYIKMALKTGASIIPVSVVGAEETYISLAKSPTMAKLLGMPYFPISPTFPWLGVFGFIPLPTKWYIDIGVPIPMDSYGPEAADNLVLVSQLSDQVRNVVQQQIYVRLAQRRSVFFG